MHQKLINITALVAFALVASVRATSQDAITYMDKKGLGLCRLSAKGGAGLSISSVDWTFGPRTENPEEWPGQQFVVATWLSETSDYRAGAAQGTYYMNNTHEQDLLTMGLLSSVDGKFTGVDCPPVDFAFGGQFELLQNQAWCARGRSDVSHVVKANTQAAPASKTPRNTFTIIGGCLSTEQSFTVLNQAVPCGLQLTIRELTVTLSAPINAAPILNCANHAVAVDASPGPAKNSWVFPDVFFWNVEDP